MDQNMTTGTRRYIISEAAARTGLEAHVLRYWEEELGLQIGRNELGHRYYTEEQLALFCKVKELKERGYQLRAIKAELADPSVGIQVTNIAPLKEEERAREDKMAQFKAIIGSIVTESLRENNVVLGKDLSQTVGDRVIKEMDYLFRVKEEAEEERYKKLDETIRNCQRTNKEAAASSEPRKRSRRKRK